MLAVCVKNLSGKVPVLFENRSDVVKFLIWMESKLECVKVIGLREWVSCCYSFVQNREETFWSKMRLAAIRDCEHYLFLLNVAIGRDVNVFVLQQELRRPVRYEIEDLDNFISFFNAFVIETEYCFLSRPVLEEPVIIVPLVSEPVYEEPLVVLKDVMSFPATYGNLEVPLDLHDTLLASGWEFFGSAVFTSVSIETVNVDVVRYKDLCRIPILEGEHCFLFVHKSMNSVYTKYTLGFKGSLYTIKIIGGRNVSVGYDCSVFLWNNELIFQPYRKVKPHADVVMDKCDFIRIVGESHPFRVFVCNPVPAIVSLWDMDFFIVCKGELVFDLAAPILVVKRVKYRTKKVVALLASGVYSVLYMYWYNDNSHMVCWSKMSSRLKIRRDLVHATDRPICFLIDYLGSVCISLFKAVPANIILLSKEENLTSYDFNFAGWDFGSDYDPIHPWLTCYCDTPYNSPFMIIVANQVYRLGNGSPRGDDSLEPVPDLQPGWAVEEFGLTLPDPDVYRARIREGLPYDVGVARLLGVLEFDSDEEDYNRDSDHGQSDQDDGEDYT